jgi:hypothetical protein
MSAKGTNTRRWAQTGLVAAGFGAAALLGGAGAAAAAPDDDPGSERLGSPAANSTAAQRDPAGTGPVARAATAAREGHRAGLTSRTTSRAAAAETAVEVNVPVAPALSVPTVPVREARSQARPAVSVPVSAAPKPATSPQASAVATPPAASAKSTPTARPPGPIMAAITAAQAYIYGYPLMEYERVRSEAPSLNTLINLTTFANPDVDPIWTAIGGGKRPNVDTFYSLAELDLSGGPVLLSIPDMGSRYYSFQLTDPYINVTGYIGSRTTGTGPGTYAITWDGGPQVDVPGATVVEVPYASMLMLGRTLAGDEPDQELAIELIRQYTLTPTGATGPNNAILPAGRSGIAYLDAISAAMAQNPPPAIDDPELAKLARIGVGPGLQVSDANLGPLALLAVDLSVKVTAAVLPALTQLTQVVSAFQNRGWAIPNSNIGNYGTDYLLRAGVAEVGLVANTEEEAMYEAGLLDAWYLPLVSILPFKRYTLHFAAGELPPAEAFWSLTVYDSAGKLVPNAEGRYSVSNSRPAELVYRPDGSIDIIISRTDPQDPGANWLAAPVGGLNAYLRMYVPEPSALDRSWTPPPIRPQWAIFG